MSRWFAITIRGFEAREIIHLWECHWGQHISYLLLPHSCLLFHTAVSHQSALWKQYGTPYPIPCEGEEVVPATFKGGTKKVLFHISNPSYEHSSSVTMVRLMVERKGSVIIYYQATILRSSYKFYIFPQLPFPGTSSLIFYALRNLKDHQLPMFC